MNIKKIAAVVVLYQPNWALLAEALESIDKQCEATIVIDNTPWDNTDQFKETFPYLKNAMYLPLLENHGIAYAQNRGIDEVVKAGCDAVIFFDQDSVPEKTLVAVLKESHEVLQKMGKKVGAVGPRAFSRATEQQYEAKFATGRPVFEGMTEIKQLISSGSLVDIDTFNQVGGFEEKLFIDIVDFEWCWRACNQYDYKHYIIEGARLSHMFGLSEKRIFNFRITIPSAFRIYYQFRNYIVLMQRGYIPLYWKLSNAFKLSVKFILFPLICADRINYLKNSIKGILDGIKYRK